MLLGVLAALGPALWMWGFTVDDALIPVRYARHLSAGLGWRFGDGASTDGVTPLPWPLFLVPLARTGTALDVLVRAKLLGLAAWVVAGAALGRAVGLERAAPGWARGAILAVVALSVPLAAHGVSGLETPLATLLATSAVVLCRRPWAAALCAGLAASFRPEMAPWACALAAGLSLSSGEGPRGVMRAVALALVPFGVCAVVRALAWGRPAPLAVWAKPSDVAHGLAYAAAGAVVAVLPVLVAAPRALARTPRGMAIAVAAIVQGAVIVGVGGDWMPYARLWVPVLPSLAYAGALVAARAATAATVIRFVVAIGLASALLVRNGGEGRRVGPDRAALVARARPWLADAKRIAALDIGWVSAATDADVLDLAGVTDPEVASLPGGHTSKRVGAMFLLGRDPDALLLYAPKGLPAGALADWQQAEYPRVVEARLAHDEVIERHFAPAAWLPLGPRGAGYVLLRKR
jgi:hypothetical protein